MATEPKQKPDEVDGDLITAEELKASVAQLKERAKEAGVHPVQVMVASYVKQGFNMVNGLLDALEGKKDKAPEPEPEPAPEPVATVEETPEKPVEEPEETRSV